MKCPKCGSEVNATALNCPACQAVTPRGQRAVRATAQLDRRHYAVERALERLGVVRDERGKLQLARWHTSLAIALFVPLCLFTVYKLTEYYQLATDPNLQSLEAQAITMVRRTPSTTAGLTVEDRVTQLTEEEVAGQRVKEIEGWSCQPLADSWIVAYGYDALKEKREAQWRVDLAERRIEPLNQWAKELTPTD